MTGRPLALAATTAALSFTLACGSSSETTTSTTAPSDTRCSITVSLEPASFPANGGAGVARVSTNRECSWTARSEAPWLAIGSTTSGQGDGNVPFVVAANSEPSSRTAQLTINDGRAPVAQEGRPCELLVSSTRESIEAGGGERTVQVSATSTQCSWTAASNVPWIAVTAGRDGRGNGTVVFRVEPAPAPRSGTLTVAGQTVQVEQGTGCSVSVGSSEIAVDAAGGLREIAVAAPPGCPWTAESRAAWIALERGSSGSGAGTVSVRIAGTAGPARTGALSVAGRLVIVTQSPGCAFTVEPRSVDLPAGGGPASIRVDTAVGCEWTVRADSAWVPLPIPGGSGPSRIDLTIPANAGPARRATVSIAGQTIAFAQASGCTYSISPSSQEVAGGGGTGAVSIATAAGCPWTAASGAPWLSLSAATGTGPAQVTFTAAPNASPARSGSLTIAGNTFTVAQPSMCSYVFSPPSHVFDATGGGGNVLVIVSGPCSWTATTSEPWIVITAGTSGTGNGLVQFTVPPNAGPPRSGVLQIAGQAYAVTQGGR